MGEIEDLLDRTQGDLFIHEEKGKIIWGEIHPTPEFIFLNDPTILDVLPINVGLLKEKIKTLELIYENGEITNITKIGKSRIYGIKDILNDIRTDEEVFPIHIPYNYELSSGKKETRHYTLTLSERCDYQALLVGNKKGYLVEPDFYSYVTDNLELNKFFKVKNKSQILAFSKDKRNKAKALLRSFDSKIINLESLTSYLKEKK